jgi:hypothetical protein
MGKIFFFPSKTSLHRFADCYANLRDFIEHFDKKNLTKKNFKKKNQKIFREIFFSIFFWLSRFHIQFGACLRKFGGARPAGLGGDRERTDST